MAEKSAGLLETAAALIVGTAAGTRPGAARLLCCCLRSSFLPGPTGQTSVSWASFALEPGLVSAGPPAGRCCWRCPGS